MGHQSREDSVVNWELDENLSPCPCAAHRRGPQSLKTVTSGEKSHLCGCREPGSKPSGYKLLCAQLTKLFQKRQFRRSDGKTSHSPGPRKMAHDCPPGSQVHTERLSLLVSGQGSGHARKRSLLLPRPVAPGGEEGLGQGPLVLSAPGGSREHPRLAPAAAAFPR